MEGDHMVTHVMVSEKIFYNDMAEAEQQKWAARLGPFSHKCLFRNLSYVGWRDIPSTYIDCWHDQVVPIDAQRGMVTGSGVSFQKETLDMSHSPVLSMPDQVAAAVRRAAGEITVKRTQICHCTILVISRLAIAR